MVILFPGSPRRTGASALADIRIAHAFGLAMLCLLSACATMPTSGPTASQVKGGSSTLPFEIVDIDEKTSSPTTAATIPGSLASLAADGRVDRVGPGDVLQITLFEVGVSLFSGNAFRSSPASGSDEFDPTARGQPIGAFTVDGEGTIRFPYIGRIAVKGKTTGEIERLIEAGLAGKSQQAQASVSLRMNVANRVYLLGDVKKPGSTPLLVNGQRLLDVIADAQGSTSPAADTIVRFTRGEKMSEMRLSDIQVRSPNDLVLLPGDRIQLFTETRSYTVFGATPKVSQVSFQSSSISLAEAIARVGGPNDMAADPSAVFLFRFEKDRGQPEKEIPRVYRLNMMKPESYLLSQHFDVRDKDVIFFANAASNRPNKLVQILNQLFSPLVLARQALKN